MNFVLSDDLKSSIEDKRYVAWYELYSMQDSESIIEHVIKRDDDVLKVYAARFFSSIPDAEANAFIMHLFVDDNKKVFEAACRAFKQSQYDEKYHSLIALLDQENETLLEFVIDSLAEKQIDEAVPPLLDLIDRASRSIQNKIFKTLKYYKDRRILPKVSEYLEHSDPELRHGAVLVYASLYELDPFYTRKPFYKLIRDDSVKIRRLGLWALARFPKKDDLPYLITCSLEDKEAAVRQDALEEISYFNSSTILKHLVRLLSYETNKMVALKAESILFSYDIKILKKSLYKSLKDSSQKIRFETMRLLARISPGSKAYYKFLKKQLLAADEEQEKAFHINNIAQLNNRDSMPLMIEYLKEKPLVALSAVKCIQKLLNDNDVHLVQQILLDQKIRPIIKQTLLKFLIYHRANVWLTQGTVEILIGLLREPNQNVRYLSAELLTSIDSKEAMQALVDLVVNEDDVVLIDAIKQQLESLFKYHLGLVFEKLEDDCDGDPVFLFAILQEIIANSSEFEDYNGQLLDYITQFIEQDYHKEKMMDLLCLMHQKSLIDLDGIIDRFSDKSMVFEFLNCLNHSLDQVVQERHVLPIFVLDELIEDESPENILIVVKLLLLISDSSCIPFLVRARFKQGMDRYADFVNDSIHKVMRVYSLGSAT